MAYTSAHNILKMKLKCNNWIRLFQLILLNQIKMLSKILVHYCDVSDGDKSVIHYYYNIV